MTAAFLVDAPADMLERAEGEGRYSAFGVVFAGPRRILDGHCPEAAPDAEPELWIDIVHDHREADPTLWRCLISRNSAVPPGMGRHFVRLLEHVDGATRRFELILGLWVEVALGSRRLRIGAPATMHPDTLGAFVTGSAMLCYFKAQQRLCLHAAVAARDDHALLICGPSGAGKSSLAAAMQRQNWRIVAEDLAVIEFNGAAFQVRPGYARLRLWSDSVRALSLGSQCSQIASGTDKHYLALPTHEGFSPPLSAIVFLREREREAGSPIDVQPMHSPAVAMAQLYANSLAPYMNIPGEVRRLLGMCQQMAAALPSFSVRLADDWSRIDEATTTLGRILEPIMLHRDGA